MTYLSPDRQGGEAERLAPWGQGPGRLWSLWDMLNFDANSFVFLAAETKRLSAHLEAISPDEDQWRSADIRESDALVFEEHLEFLKNIGFDMSWQQTERIVRKCRADMPLSHKEMATMAAELSTRISDEANLFSFLVLTRKEAEYLNPKTPIFGQLFNEKFPTEGVFELDEAAKCYALGRYTASVFHLMRLMEVGILALSRCLDIPDPVKSSQRNWAFILKSIKEGIDNKWRSEEARILANAEIFQSLHASLDAVRNPWRNATMHVDNKYTDEESEHIFVAVKGFMKKLASRMDEQGEPKA